MYKIVYIFKITLNILKLKKKSLCKINNLITSMPPCNARLFSYEHKKLNTNFSLTVVLTKSDGSISKASPNISSSLYKKPK